MGRGGGGGPAEPVAERHPQSDPSEKLTIAVKQSELADDVKSICHAELVSASIPHCELPVALDRSRNEFGMTAKSVPSLRTVVDRVAIQSESNMSLHYVNVSRLSQYETGSTGGGLLRHYVPRNDNDGQAGFLFDWSLKSHVQPLWMALSAFTMAEILLSLTIIGVVAAITLPSLTGNINERTWSTQRKALYARFSQAIALMPSLNGYGTLTEDESGNVVEDTAAETFITSGLSKVLKINNICDYEHLEDCGIKSEITTQTGNRMAVPKSLSELNSLLISAYDWSITDTKAAAFETQNGESIVTYYNPRCVFNQNSLALKTMQSRMCANFIYDLNGTKGPNTYGKDIGFMTVFYPVDSVVVAPHGAKNLKVVVSYRSTAGKNASSYCTEQAGTDYRLPNIYELASIFANDKLSDGFVSSGNTSQAEYWSSTVYNSERAYSFSFDNGSAHTNLMTDIRVVGCVMRD